MQQKTKSQYDLSVSIIFLYLRNSQLQKYTRVHQLHTRGLTVWRS